MQDLLGDFFYPFYSERLYQRMNAETILDDDYDEDDDDDDDNEEDKDGADNPEGDDHAGDEYFDGLALLTAGATSDASAGTPDEGPTRLSIRYPGTGEKFSWGTTDGTNFAASQRCIDKFTNPVSHKGGRGNG